MPETRSRQLDALRGFALMGIIIVNIQSFVTGIEGAPLGFLTLPSSHLDVTTVWLTALLFQSKFYAIFCVCFGYGFAVLAKRWRRQGVVGRVQFTKRLNVLLAFGLLHGWLIWFGDILLGYALTGFILRRHLDAGPRRLWQALKFWILVFLLLTTLMAALVTAFHHFGSDADAPRNEADKLRTMLANTATYSSGTWWQIAQLRLSDWLSTTLSFVSFIPAVMVLFLLGALAAQMGWIRDPERHQRLWRRIFWFALLVGLPINLLYANHALEFARAPQSPLSIWMFLLGSFAPILSAAWVAAIMLMSETLAGRAFVAAFAPAGRLSLSNYLAQSLVLSTLLYGYGFALGNGMGQAALFALALAVYAVLLALSHLLLRRYATGPAEWLWRRLS